MQLVLQSREWNEDVNGVRRGAVYALTVYTGNSLKPMLDAFANRPIYHGHLAYFVATSLLSLTEPISVRFRLTIEDH